MKQYRCVVVLLVVIGSICGMEYESLGLQEYDKRFCTSSDLYTLSNAIDFFENGTDQKSVNLDLLRDTSSELVKKKRKTERQLTYFHELEEIAAYGIYGLSVETLLKKTKFINLEYEHKQIIFAATQKTYNESMLEGLILYVMQHNKLQGEFLTACRKLDAIRKTQHTFSEKLIVLEDVLERFKLVYPTKRIHEFELIGYPRCNALMLAVQIGCLQKVEELSKVIDSNARDADGKTALFYCNDLAMAEKLVTEKKITTHVVDNYGRTPLFYIDDYETAVFMSKYILVNHCDNDQKNLLFFCNHKKLMELYISLGANVNVVDKYGETPLFAHGNSDVLTEVLILYGAFTKYLNNKNQTPLFAARTEWVARRLIQCGVDISVLDNSGRDWKAYIKHVSIYSPLAQELLKKCEDIENESVTLH
jgi:hypothetical protein